MGLRDHAASITQHLHTATSSSAPATAAAHAMGGAEGGAGSGFSFGFHLPAPQGWGGGLRLPGTGAGGSPQGPSMRQLPLGKPPAVPPSLSPRSTGPPHTQHQRRELPEEEQWDDEHLWAPSPAALFLPWAYGLALLQEQHEAWAAQQPALLHLGTSRHHHLGRHGHQQGHQHKQHKQPNHPHLPTSAGPGGRPTTAPGGAVAGRMAAGSGGGVSGGAAGALPAPAPLSASAKRTASSGGLTAAGAAAAGAAGAEVFAGYRDDATAAVGEPPGAFDLRDLYRLIRVLEVAAEDLEAYDSSAKAGAAAASKLARQLNYRSLL
eukprot:XP_001694573.1 predicted protein [Chlamydomonas reinhardtii]